MFGFTKISSTETYFNYILLKRITAPVKHFSPWEQFIIYAWCLFTSEQSSIIWNMSQRKTTSAFINAWSWMSLLGNHELKTVANMKITICWYQIRLTSLQRSTQVPVTVRRSFPTQTFDGSHLLNVFAEQPIPDVFRGPACQRQPDIWKVPHRHDILLQCIIATLQSIALKWTPLFKYA